MITPSRIWSSFGGSWIAATRSATGLPAAVRKVNASPRARWWSEAKERGSTAPDLPSAAIEASEPCVQSKCTTLVTAASTPWTPTFALPIRPRSKRTDATVAPVESSAAAAVVGSVPGSPSALTT